MSSLETDGVDNGSTVNHESQNFVGSLQGVFPLLSQDVHHGRISKLIFSY